MRKVYLDHHATTPVDPAVVAAMLPYLTEKFGNPSSRQHLFGQEAHAAVEDARAQLAARGRHVVTTAIEHPAVLEPCRTLEKDGFEVTVVGVGGDGVVSPDDVV